MRIILYTGKGGVGKTSISAATAIRGAESGRKTLVMSTDVAHSLADSLETSLNAEPTKVAKNLYALEINVNVELRKNWSAIQDYITGFLSSQGIDPLQAEEISLFPGVDELFSLLKLYDIYRREEFELIVLDTAPTGATARMLGLPDAFRWYMDKFFNLERRLVKAIKPIAERVVNFKLPTDDVFGSIETLYNHMTAVRELLSDREVSSIRIVMNPEKMSIAESKRAYSYLNLFGYPTDAVAVNKVFPDEAGNGYFAKWKKIQEKNMLEIEQAFHPLPVLKMRLHNEEIVGRKLLRVMAEELFQDVDAAAVFHKAEPILMKRVNGGYEVSFPMPGVTREQLNLWCTKEELFIEVNNYRKNIYLPQTLAGLDIAGARMEGERFVIKFARAE